MAKTSRKSTPKQETTTAKVELNKEQGQFIIQNLSKLTMSRMANELDVDVALVKEFIEKLPENKGKGVSRALFAKTTGVVMSTSAASERGDDFKKGLEFNSRKASDCVFRRDE